MSSISEKLLFAENPDLSVVQKDGSPYKSSNTFEELQESGIISDQILEGIYSCGFERPSYIQGIAIPMIAKPPFRHLVAQSQNGTGKTLAFAIGTLCRINPDDPTLQALVIVTHRALSTQAFNLLSNLSQSMNISIVQAKNEMRKGTMLPKCQVLVSTPGLIFEKFNDTINFNTLRIFVVDEADEVLGNDSLRSQFERLFSTKVNDKNVQIVLFSATLNQHVSDFVARHMQSFQEIRVKTEEMFIPTNEHFNISVNCDEEKEKYLLDIYRYASDAHSFIFVKKKETTKALQELLKSKGYESTIISQDVTPADQDRALRLFDEGLIKVLITTDINARGVDIPAAKLVINYDLPSMKVGNRYQADLATYTHRQGRTGRFGRRGKVINFVNYQFKTDAELIERLETENCLKFQKIEPEEISVFREE